MSSSNVTIIPERFCGLRVLLAEYDMMSLQKHACLLQRSSYQVTVTTEAYAGLSMIKHGQTFDCFLIDGDLCETDMEPFLHQVWSHQPQMSIIVMAAYDTHLRIPEESLESGAVVYLLRPNCFTDICNIWKHICRNNISSEENVSNEMLNQENQVDNNVLTGDPRVEPSAINGGTAVNNNILSENSTDRQTLGINSQQHDVSYGDLFPEDVGGDDDVDDQEDVNEIMRRENAGIGATRKEDKGKQPLIPKRKCDQPVEDDKHPTKKIKPKSRITWKGELEAKFQNALKELGEQATSKEILRYMNVPGLTRYHVASHQQKHRNKVRSLDVNIAEFSQKGTKFQVQGVANERFRHPVRSDEIAPVTKSRSILRLPKFNLKGILYMLIENIMNIILQTVAPPLPVPQTTIAPYNNYGGDQATVHSSRGKGIETQLMGNDYANVLDPLVTGETSSHHAFGEAMAPLVNHNYGGGQTTAHSFGVVENPNSGGLGIPLMEHDYGNPMDPVVTGETSLHDTFGEAMAPLSNYVGGQTTTHSFGVVENSNSGGRGAGIQLMRHDYENAAVDPMETGETSSHHAYAFGKAMAPLGSDNYGHDQAIAHSFGGVGNSNSGGQGTKIQLMGHDYGNQMNAMVTGETSSHHAFGKAMAPLGENSNSGDHGFGSAMGPQVSCDQTSSQHAFGEVIVPLGVGSAVASHNNLGIDFSPLFNGVDNGIFGDASGSASNEVQVQLPWFQPEPEQVADFGGIGVIQNHNQENLDSPNVFSLVAANLYPSQDVQVNIENLGPDSPPPATFFVLENSINPGSSLDSIPSGPASANLAPIQLPMNSGFPSCNSEAGYLDNVPSNSDIENTMGFYNGDDGNLFDGPFYL